MHVVFQSGECMFNLMLTLVPGNAKHLVLNVQFSVGMMYTAFPVLVLMYI